MLRSSRCLFSNPRNLDILTVASRMVITQALQVAITLGVRLTTILIRVTLITTGGMTCHTDLLLINT